MQSHHSALIFLIYTVISYILYYISYTIILPSISKQLYYSDAEGTIRWSVCASAEQAMARCTVAPGDSQVSAAGEDLWGLVGVEGGRWPHKAASRQKTLAYAAERRAAPEVNIRHANQVKAHAAPRVTNHRGRFF